MDRAGFPVEGLQGREGSNGVGDGIGRHAKTGCHLWRVGCVGISLQCNSHERKITVNGLGTRGSVGVDALGRLDRYRGEFVGFVVKPINHAILTVEVAP
jgi:hypothetical protein